MHFKGKLKILTMVLGSSIKKKIRKQAQVEFAKLKEICERSDK
jgi:hypothetical protein